MTSTNAEPPRAAGAARGFEIDSLGEPSSDFLRLIPHEFARRHLILSGGPVDPHDSGTRPGVNPVERLRVAARSDPAAVFNVGVRLGRAVTTTLDSEDRLAEAIDAAYENHREQPPREFAEGDRDTRANGHLPGLDIPEVAIDADPHLNIEAEMARAVQEADSDLLSTSGKAPAVRLVDLILFEAVRRGASDVHIQPTRERTVIRYRLDGALHTVRELPGSVTRAAGSTGLFQPSLAAAIISRIKVMGQLDVAEQRAPQDGRATVSIGRTNRYPSSGGSEPLDQSTSRRIDLRISTIPCTYGERVVLRLLDASRSSHLLDFAHLGMPPDVEAAYLGLVAKTSGIVLSTGPTGSGKTTTLYTTLSWITKAHSKSAGGLNRGGRPGRSRTGGCELNMMTIEDPVEYDLAGVSLDGGSTAGLLVSQTQVDPKKHVTFASGLRHILRQDPDVIMVGEVRDQETARIAVQASLTGHLVLSTLHTNDAPSAVARLVDLGIEPFLVASSLSGVLAQRLVRKVHQPCGGVGCLECLETGYKGRTGVFELLVLEASLRDLVNQRVPVSVLKQRAEELGMVPLKQAGAALVRQNLTTAAEVARVIEALDEEDLA